MPCKRNVFGLLSFLLMLCFMLSCPPSFAQPEADKRAEQTGPTENKIAKVDIKPQARDEQISERITNILRATQWYENPKAQVENGIVFLGGETKTSEHKAWAEALAQNTQDVVAVVNKIKITGEASWYFQQIIGELQSLWERMVRGLPFFVFAFIVLGLAWLVARGLVSYMRKLLNARKMHPLLAEVAARGLGLLCLLLGLYFVLKVLGLSTIALTVLGGTGLIGIILGIAFRDITENLLASIFLSVQKPFQNDDLIEIEGVIGYVQALTIRATILISLDGHQVQIPNASVYKSNIHNFTSNPNRREDFIIGIGYEDSISHAQEVAFRVLENHPAVLADPAPWVLVDNLATACVNLRIYFWLDSREYHWRKVKSSVIRLIKRAFQDEGISMPGNEVNLHFPENLSIERLEKQADKEPATKKKTKSPQESTSIATDAEGRLSSEKEELQENLRRSRPVSKGDNLLD